MKTGFCILFLLGIVVGVHSKAFDDELFEEVQYCENVKAGIWPDYKNLYAKMCKKYENEPQKVLTAAN